MVKGHPARYWNTLGLVIRLAILMHISVINVIGIHSIDESVKPRGRKTLTTTGLVADAESNSEMN